MMTYLVRDDIGLGKVSRRIESLRQLIIKAQVDVDLLIRGTIEGSRLGTALATTGYHAVGKQLQNGEFVFLPVPGKFGGPNVFRISQHHLHKMKPVLLFGAAVRERSSARRRP